MVHSGANSAARRFVARRRRAQELAAHGANCRGKPLKMGGFLWHPLESLWQNGWVLFHFSVICGSLVVCFDACMVLPLVLVLHLIHGC